MPTDRHALLESLTVQILASMLCAVIIPQLLIYPILSSSTFSVAGLANSAIGASIGVVFGLIFVRRVSAFPGAAAFGFILPAFVASFGLIALALLVLRLDYSRLCLGLSFACTIVVNYLIYFWLDRHVRLQFYVVPFGDTKALDSTYEVDWIQLEEPTLPEGKCALVADLHFDHDPRWERLLAEAAVAGRPVYHTKLLRESLTGRVTIEHLSENSFGSLLPNLVYVKIKRFLDVAACLIFSPILFLVGAVIAAVVYFDSPGPVLFRQERMGYRGRPFMMIKFRTMKTRAEVDDEDVARFDAMTQKDDQRVTRSGKFMRRTRLDELPQFINVLTGHMSVIGPRPEAMTLSRWYESEIPFYFYRHIVRPGISGWAQVNQGHVTQLDDITQKLDFDFYYIKNFSLSLDILIALKTLRIMSTGFGAK